MDPQQITDDIARLRGVLAGMRTDVENALKQSEELADSLQSLQTTLLRGQGLPASGSELPRTAASPEP